MSEKIEGTNTVEVGREEIVKKLQINIGALESFAAEEDKVGYFPIKEFVNLVRSVKSNLDPGGDLQKAKAQGKEAVTQYIAMREKEIKDAQKEIDELRNDLSQLEKL